MQVNLEEHEWNQVISAIAAPVMQQLVEQHPLLSKITAQLVAQRKANGDAATRLGQRPDKGVVSSRVEAAVATPDYRDSPQQRAPGQTPRR